MKSNSTTYRVAGSPGAFPRELGTRDGGHLGHTHTITQYGQLRNQSIRNIDNKNNNQVSGIKNKHL